MGEFQLIRRHHDRVRRPRRGPAGGDAPWVRRRRAANWHQPKVVETVVAAGRRVITPDARGHGRSGKPHDIAAYQGQAMPRDVSALLDHLGLDRSRRRRLLDGCPHHRAGRAERGTRALHRARRCRRRRDPGTQVLPELERIAAALTAPDKSAIADATARGFRRFAESTGADRQALAAVMRAGMEQPPQTLGSLSMPALVICGDKGQRWSARPQALADAIPGAELVDRQRRPSHRGRRPEVPSGDRRLPHEGAPVRNASVSARTASRRSGRSGEIVRVDTGRHATTQRGCGRRSASMAVDRGRGSARSAPLDDRQHERRARAGPRDHRGGGELRRPRAGVTTSVVAALAFNFFHTQPYYSLRISDRFDIITTVLLAVVGLAVGEIAVLSAPTRGRRGRARDRRSASRAGRRSGGEAAQTSRDVWDAVRAGSIAELGTRAMPLRSGDGTDATFRASSATAVSLEGERYLRGRRLRAAGRRSRDPRRTTAARRSAAWCSSRRRRRAVSRDQRRVGIALADQLAVVRRTREAVHPLG